MKVKNKTYEELQKRLYQVKDMLREHDYNKYILDAPSISDYDYNKLLDELKSIEKEIDITARNN